MKLLKPMVLALACALLLAGMNLQTRGVIEDNQRFFEQKLLRLMVADVSNNPDVIQTALGYQVLEQDRIVAQINRVLTTRGYNGNIAMLVAQTPDGKILDVRVTEHRETPGIGDKIDSNISPWIIQFKGMSRETNWSVEPGGDIDAITGATITSRAVSQAIAESLPE